MNEPVAFDKMKTLAELSAGVARHEGNVGRLVALGRTDEYSVAEYSAGYTPDNSIELQEVEDDSAEAPDGYDLVCRGDCWAEGKEIRVIAIREI